MERSYKISVIFLKAIPVAFIIYSAGALIYSMLNASIDYAVDVEPARLKDRQTIAQYSHSKVIGTGVITVADPDLKIKLLWNPTNPLLPNLIVCLFTIFIAAQVFHVLKIFTSPDPSREKIHIYIRRTGLAFFMLHFVNIGRTMIVREQVLSFTNNEYELDKNFYTIAGIWVAVLILALSLATKQIAGLKKEQELTI